MLIPNNELKPIGYLFIYFNIRTSADNDQKITLSVVYFLLWCHTTRLHAVLGAAELWYVGAQQPLDTLQTGAVFDSAG